MQSVCWHPRSHATTEVRSTATEHWVGISNLDSSGFRTHHNFATLTSRYSKHRKWSFGAIIFLALVLLLYIAELSGVSQTMNSSTAPAKKSFFRRCFRRMTRGMICHDHEIFDFQISVYHTFVSLYYVSSFRFSFTLGLHSKSMHTVIFIRVFKKTL